MRPTRRLAARLVRPRLDGARRAGRGRFRRGRLLRASTARPRFFEVLKNPIRRRSPARPRRSSSASGSADFLWTGPGGGSVLAHFMVVVGLYCTGDNIDYDESLQMPGGHLGDFMVRRPDVHRRENRRLRRRLEAVREDAVSVRAGRLRLSVTQNPS